MRRFILTINLFLTFGLYVQYNFLCDDNGETGAVKRSHVNSSRPEGNHNTGSNKFYKKIDSNGNDQILDSIYRYEYYPSGDSGLYGKSVYTYSNNFKNYMIVNWSWNPTLNKWDAYSSLDFYDRMGSDKDSSYFYYWEPESQYWRLSSKRVWEYNADDINISYTRYFWNSDTEEWEKYYKWVDDYDENSNNIKLVVYYGDEFNNWEPYEKFDYGYDSLNNNINSIYSEWNNYTLSWDYRGKNDYYFNSQNLCDSSYMYLWKVINKQSKEILNLDINTSTSISTEELSQSEFDWELMVKEVYNYGENNLVDSIDRYSPSDNIWILLSRYNYSYDYMHNIVSFLHRHLDTVNNVWINQTKSTSAYSYEIDENGFKTYYETKRWYTDNTDTVSKWIGTSKYQYILDSYGYKNIYIDYEWSFDNDMWYNDKKYFYYYSPITAIENSRVVDIEYFPNPVSDFLTIKNSNGQQIHCIITSLTGLKLAELKLSEQETRINMQNYPAGIYFLQLKSGNEIVSKKIIKQ